MDRNKRLRREQARRALFDLQELVLDILEENSQATKGEKILKELGILPADGEKLYRTGGRKALVWGILHGLAGEGLVRGTPEGVVLSSSPPRKGQEE